MLTEGFIDPDPEADVEGQEWVLIAGAILAACAALLILVTVAQDLV
jgi:hypothetical protein